MKVFINNQENGYLILSIIHGLSLLDDCELTLSNDILECLYTDQKGLIDESTIKKYYGHAFTINRNKIHIDHNLDSIKENIINHYYDLCIFNICNDDLIYNSIFTELLKLSYDYYKINELLIIDENDNQSILPLPISFEKYLYFKREFTCGNMLHSNVFVFPISYSIPQEKFVSKNYYKTLNPICHNYHYDGMMYNLYNRSESSCNSIDEYFNEYRNSPFALTGKHGGYERMVHYEIIAGHCLPVYIDYIYMPRTVMTTWPSDLQMCANSLYHQYIFNYDFNDDKYFKLLDDFYDYGYNNLTTKNIVEYLLSFV